MGHVGRSSNELCQGEREGFPAGTMGSDPAMDTSSNHIVALEMHLLSFCVTTAWPGFLVSHVEVAQLNKTKMCIQFQRRRQAFFISYRDCILQALVPLPSGLALPCQGLLQGE